jgi:non-ribosomal peptide synthetase component F
MAPDEPACVFFTSGSTGIPKGVLGCHKGLAHFVNCQRETFVVGPGDRVAQLTSLSFDPVLRDVFLPLTSGATLCLPEESDRLGGTPLARWLAREEISILHTGPSLAQIWLTDIVSPVCLPKLRHVFFAGEPLTMSLVMQWRIAFPGPHQLVNLYGPTETTMVKCFYRVPLDPLSGIQPIGHPLPQTQVLVLNDAAETTR